MSRIDGQSGPAGPARPSSRTFPGITPAAPRQSGEVRHRATRHEIPRPSGVDEHGREPRHDGSRRGWRRGRLPSIGFIPAPENPRMPTGSAVALMKPKKRGCEFPSGTASRSRARIPEPPRRAAPFRQRSSKREARGPIFPKTGRSRSPSDARRRRPRQLAEPESSPGRRSNVGFVMVRGGVGRRTT